VRSQFYQAFLKELPQLRLPFLECVIEVKLYRDLAHPNRTESPVQQAEYATQAISKVVAILDAQSEYYPCPFGSKGLILLCDNSLLACQESGAWARVSFRRRFDELLNWDSLPNTLSCLWVSERESQLWKGTRPPRLLG